MPDNNVFESDKVFEKSAEIDEVLSAMPHWMIRWGMLLILIIVTVFLILSWIIKYPDIVHADVVITSKTPPIRVYTKIDGHVNFIIKDKQSVTLNQPIAFISNDASFTAVNKLRDIIRNSGQELQPNICSEFELGQISVPCNDFLIALERKSKYEKLNLKLKNTEHTKTLIEKYQRLITELNKQKQLIDREYKLAKEKLQMNQNLFDQEVISLADFNEIKNEFIRVENKYSELENNRINLELQIEIQKDKLKQHSIDHAQKVMDLSHTVSESKKALSSSIDSWFQKYVITSPINGKVTLHNYWEDGQFISSDQTLMTIVPNHKDLIATLSLSIEGAGKVVEDQKILIRLNDFPAQEFGIINARVKNISTVPSNDKYLLKAELPDELITSYGINLGHHYELHGNAQIVTKDVRLLHRIFNQLRSLLDRLNG